MRIDVGQQSRMEGWGYSLLIHGFLFLAITPLFRQIPTPSPPETFQWNVAFVESHEPGSPNGSVQENAGANDSTSTTPASTQRPTLSTPHATTTIEQPAPGLTERTHQSNTEQPLTAGPPPTSIAQPEPTVSAPLVALRPATTMPQDTPSLPDAAAEPAKTVPSMPAAGSDVSTATAEEAWPLRPASARTETAGPTTAAQNNLPVLAASIPAAAGQPSASRADYGWLQRAVSRRLEELKRSSRPSLDEATIMKVLVKAVVSGRGELVEAEVVKSSGSERIDREAMTLVQRAFPMTLDYAIDRPHIVMRIPVTYSRD